MNGVKKILSLLYIYQFISITIYYIKEKLLLFPLYTQYISLDKIENVETIYLENDSCVNIFFPENEEHYKKCLFMFNDFSGNSNSKYLLVKQLQKVFSSFTIIQLEYPGFGMSFHQKSTISNIFESCLETINLILINNNIIQYGFFSERFGSSVISHLLEKDLKPNFIIYYNPIYDFYHSSLEILPVIFQPFLFPLLYWKNESKIQKNTNIYIIYTKKWEKDSLQKYTFLKNKKMNISIQELKGKENFGLLIQRNQKVLRTFFSQINI
jgi:hypothetical protein